MSYSKTHTFVFVTHEGVQNPKAFDYIQTHSNITHLIFFTDGSSNALDYLANIKIPQALYDRLTIGVAKTPLFEAMLRQSDSATSKPVYFHDAQAFDGWLCQDVVAPALQIWAQERGQPEATQVELSSSAVKGLTTLCYNLWKMLQIVEHGLGFPWVAIDALCSHTYYLTSRTMDIELLREATCLHTLDYLEASDLLTLNVLDEPYSVRLYGLNKVYDNIILPKFNALYGRRYQFRVSVIHNGNRLAEPILVSHGQIGQLVADQQRNVVTHVINDEHPIAFHHLKERAAKVTFDDRTCWWLENYPDLVHLVENLRQERINTAIPLLWFDHNATPQDPAFNALVADAAQDDHRDPT